MPLTRGFPIGYHAKRMVFQFSMMNGNEAILCEISNAAMGCLLGSRRVVGLSERLAVFTQLRDVIERVASNIWDNEQPPIVRIFSKHCGG
jgi:hypothetical protein